MIKKEFNDINERYGYFDLELEHPEFIQAVSKDEAQDVLNYNPGCRTLFKEEYCGSKREEFVTVDYEEQRYLKKYVELIRKNNSASVSYEEVNPQYFLINVENASENTAIIVKMTYDADFSAKVNGKNIGIERIGPDYMILYPNKSGNYSVDLKYHASNLILIGGIISIVTILILIFLSVKKPFYENKFLEFEEGDCKNGCQ